MGPLAVLALLAGLGAGEPAAAPAVSPLRGDLLYRTTLLRAAPGRLLELVAALRGKAPWIFRHSQGDHWDLMLLAPAGSDAPVAGEDLVAWQEDELVRGPDLAALPGFADAGLAHIEMFHALAGKRAELVRQREMENAYLGLTGQPQNAIFVREHGASWDAFTIGAYRNWKHYAEAQDVPAEKDEAAARAAGFAGRASIGPYLRTLIQDHHDTLAVPVR